MDTALPFGEQVKLLRKKNGFSQEELAARCALSTSLISRVERGKYRLNPPIVRLLAHELGLSDQEYILFAAAAADGEVLHGADEKCSGVSEAHRSALLMQPLAEHGSAVNTTLPICSVLHQLRAPAGDFIGRGSEVAQLVHALRRPANTEGVATIVGVRGMGGIGKTELTLVVANQLQTDYPDAQLVLELRGASDAPLSPAKALQRVIGAFRPAEKLPEEQGALQALYRSVLAGRRVLILADDAKDAAQVRPLQPPVGSALLVTSRQRFVLDGMVTLDLDHLDQEAAVQLLCIICSRLDEDQARQIARLCGYLPLALRVSAGILTNDLSLSIARYLALLADERYRLAQLRDPDDPERDVAATLYLSYVALDQPTQKAFRCLGVLAADADVSLVAAVLEQSEEEARVVLQLLLRRSLVEYDVTRERWNLHDLVRTLALDRLLEVGEEYVTRVRYAKQVIQIIQQAQEL